MLKLAGHLVKSVYILGLAKLNIILPLVKPSQKSPNMQSMNTVMLVEPICTCFTEHTFESYAGVLFLQKIIKQVNAEGFHVESVAIFLHGQHKPSEVILAVEHWARVNGLKVSINHEHGICFFEKL